MDVVEFQVSPALIAGGAAIAYAAIHVALSLWDFGSYKRVFLGRLLPDVDVGFELSHRTSIAAGLVWVAIGLAVVGSVLEWVRLGEIGAVGAVALALTGIFLVGDFRRFGAGHDDDLTSRPRSIWDSAWWWLVGGVVAAALVVWIPSGESTTRATSEWAWSDQPATNWYEGADSQLAALIGAASADVQQGRSSRGIAALHRLATEHPQVPAVQYMLGWAQIEVGSPDLGFETLRRQLARVPTRSGYRLLASTLWAHRRRDESVAVWQEALGLFPESRDFALYLGQALVETGRPEEGRVALAPLAASYPESARLHYWLGRAQAAAGAAREADETLRRLEDLETDPLILQRLAWELAEAGLALERAEALARRAVERVESSLAARVQVLDDVAIAESRRLAYCWGALGVVQFHRGDDAAAEPLLGAAWDLTAHGQFAAYLGRLHERRSQPDRARQFFLAALVASGSPDVTSNLDALGDRLAATARRAEGYEAIRARRTVALPLQSPHEGEGRAAVLIDASGRIEATRWLGGADPLRSLAEGLRADTPLRWPPGTITSVAHTAALMCDRSRCSLLFTPRVQ